MGKVTVSPRNNKQIVIPLIMALGNHVIKEIGLVEKINETVRWDPGQWEVSPGQLAKAMILASLTDMRAPLTHMSKRFAGLDTEYLFGEGIGEEAINEYNLGQMLDRLSEQDCVFCKYFLEKVASNFSIVLQLHFPQCCKFSFP